MTSEARTVTISHLGRVEGHGGISVSVSGETVLDVNMDIYEGSRYYEALPRGKHFLEVQGIITRVCAICSACHTVAALTAIENALGIVPSDRVHRLRGLLLLGATIESHALHLYGLALPDFLGHPSVIAMAATHPQEVAFALALKQLGNRIQETIGGRAVHPINTLVGGFGRLPTKNDLAKLRVELEGTLDPLMKSVATIATLAVPDWGLGPTIYVALRPYEKSYFRFRGVSICTSRGDEFSLDQYRDVIREYAVEHSRAKHATLKSGDPYMVGALARLKLWGHLLEGRAADAFASLFPRGVTDNVLTNNWAQLVELVHCVERGIEVCDLLLDLPDVPREMFDYEVRAGRGVGAIEVPRGTLFHEYEIDDDGRVVSANVITPTAQNLADTERNLRGAATAMLSRGERAGDGPPLEKGLSMLVRAYDPCISCSVHVTRIPSTG